MKRIFLISAFAMGILASCNGPQHSTANGTDSTGMMNSGTSGSMTDSTGTTGSGTTGTGTTGTDTTMMHSDTSMHRDSM